MSDFVRWITCQVGAKRLGIGEDYFRSTFCPSESGAKRFFIFREIPTPGGRRRIQIDEASFGDWLKSLERHP